jgi:hypothetical protein
MDLSGMDMILKKEATYYYNTSDQLLYKTFDGTDYSDPVDKDVDFDHEIIDDGNNVQVEIKDQTINVTDGKINVQLKYLPLTSALGDFTSTMGDKITVGELVDPVDGFGVELPAYLHDTEEKKAKTINELSDVVNGLYVAEFMGYTIQGTQVFNGTKEIKGVMAIVAKQTVEELKTIQTTINTTQIKDILDVNIKKDATGYYDDKNDNDVRDGEDTASSYIMRQVATQTVQGLSSFVSTLKLSQIFESRTGVLSLIEGDPTIEEIPGAIQGVITNTAISELINKGIVTAPDNYNKYSGDETTIDKQGGGKKTVAELTLPELLEYCFDKLDELEKFKNQGL